MTRAISANALVAGLFAAISFVSVGCGSPPAPPPPPQPDTSDAGLPAVDAAAPMASADDAGVAPPPPQDWLLLVDLDAIPPMAPVAKPETYGKLIGSTFKTFRKTKKQCTGKGDALIEVDGGYQGPFTAAGKNETLYLVNITPCDAKQAATHNLIVVGGGQVTLNQTVAENDIISVKDLDLDGDNEIFILSVENGSVHARLVDTEDGKFQMLNDFGEIANGACDATGKATGTSALVKYRKTETGLAYKVENKPKTCPPPPPAAGK